ncbi:MAG: phosphatidylserine/phosphatidylglycerophosphate/cardiolipin synthase family protein [Candidatus Tectimicrobiota bacterium]
MRVHDFDPTSGGTPARPVIRQQARKAARSVVAALILLGSVLTPLGSVHGRVTPPGAPGPRTGGDTTPRVTPLVEKAAFFQAAIDLVQRARATVRLEVYAFSGPDGMRLAHALVAKAREGVVTHILLDRLSQKRGYLAEETFNIGGANNAIPTFLRQHMAQLNQGYPPGEGPLHVLDFNDEAERNQPIDAAGRPAVGLTFHHAKGLYVDDRWSIVGGNNFDQDPTHDLSILIDDPGLTPCIIARFNLQWALAGGHPLPSSGRCAPQLAIALYTTGAGFQEAKPVLLAKLHDPRTTHLDLALYGLGDLDILAALLALHQRGGIIRVLLNKGDADPHPDNFYMASVLHRAGIPVRQYKQIPGGYMHTKLAIFNQRDVVTGSTNWLRHEFAYIWNYLFVIREPALTRQARAFFEDDWQFHSLPYFRVAPHTAFSQR